MSSSVPQDPNADLTFPLGPRKEPLPSGTNLGRFQVIRLAGQGGMGEVYQAWDRLLERHVALKSLKSLASDDESKERFRREATALAQLSHPNVCQVFDLLSIGSETFMAMEWLEGELLDQAAQRMDLRGKLAILRSVAEGLAAAHAKGLVHRDLKPGNIMVDAQGCVKILDFGLARRDLFSSDASVSAQDPLTPGRQTISSPVLKEDELVTAFRPDASFPAAMQESDSERLTRQGVFVGSPRYASPEQIRGDLAGTPSDIWSLGVVACELLLGRNPFPGKGVTRFRAIVEGRRESLRQKGIPRSWSRMLEEMLSVDSGKRPDAKHIVHRLSRILNPNRNVWWMTALAATATFMMIVTYALFGRGVAADLTRRSPARLAIYPVMNQTGLEKIGALTRLTIPEFLAAGLRSSEKLEVVDPEELRKAAKRLHLDISAGYRPEQMQQVARAAGAKLFLSCVLKFDADGKASFDAELRDAGGGVRHISRSAVKANVQGLEKACLLLADRTSRDLARAVDPLGSIKTMNLPNLDADSLDRYAQGQALMEKGDFQGAVPHFQEVAYQYPGFAAAVKGYARCLSHCSEQPVEPIFMWARMAARAQGDRKEEVLILQYLAAHLLDRGKKERAFALCEEGLQIANPLRHPLLTGMFYNEMGTIRLNQNRVSEAEDYYTKAVFQLRAADDPQALSRTLNNLGVLAKKQGKPEEADRHYRSVVETARRMGDRWGEAVALNNLGELCLARQRRTEAEDFLQQAMKLRLAIGDETGLTYTYINLAGLDQVRNQLDRACESEQKAYDLARRLGQKPLEGLCQYNLGELYRAAGQFEKARTFYQNSCETHKAIGDGDMQAHGLAGQAECLVRENARNLGKAKALMVQVHALMKDDTPYLLRTQAWILRAQGRMEESKMIFEKALQAARSTAPELITELDIALRS